MSGNQYDIIVVGGGLSGLSYAILMARKGCHVMVVEKEQYPRQRVCGEYISLESHSLLSSFGIEINSRFFPIIKQLSVTSASGSVFDTKLPLGGIGISRLFLDKKLAELAIKEGVEIKSGVAVVSLTKNTVVTNKGVEYSASWVVSGIGKSVGMMKKLGFGEAKQKDNYVGVKYHLFPHDMPSDKIELHNFEGGYAGISKVENGVTCFCYLVNSKYLKKSSNDIKKMESDILVKNKLLFQRLESSNWTELQPYVISNITFGVRGPVLAGILQIGDVAGTIAPLCGNGMSMAFHSAYLAYIISLKYFRKEITYDEMLERYSQEWIQLFRNRVKIGEYIQGFFGNGSRSEWLVRSANISPKFLTKQLIRLTHGKDFYKEVS